MFKSLHQPTSTSTTLPNDEWQRFQEMKNSQVGITLLYGHLHNILLFLIFVQLLKSFWHCGMWDAKDLPVYKNDNLTKNKHLAIKQLQDK